MVATRAAKVKEEVAAKLAEEEEHHVAAPWAHLALLALGRGLHSSRRWRHGHAQAQPSNSQISPAFSFDNSRATIFEETIAERSCGTKKGSGG